MKEKSLNTLFVQCVARSIHMKIVSLLYSLAKTVETLYECKIPYSSTVIKEKTVQHCLIEMVNVKDLSL